jgi:hypothetical protein
LISLTIGELKPTHREQAVKPIEIISEGERPLVYLIRAEWMPQKTEFLTPDHFGQQMGMIVRGARERVTPHIHLPVTREVHGTTECIVVRKGSCDIDIYDSSKTLLASRRLNTGDIALLLAGGHGFRMREDTILFEVKQGPYIGAQDKEQFEV